MSDHGDKEGLYLLGELLALEDKHAEYEGSETEGKNQAAYQALRLAGQIVENYAGWAILHMAGLGVEGQHNIPWIIQAITSRDTPGYREELEKQESHRWERAGDELFRQHDHLQKLGVPEPDARLDDPEIQRAILWNVLQPMLHSLLPNPLASRLTKEFDVAVNGGYSALFHMETVSRTYEINRWRLKAVECRAYRIARYRKNDITRSVAEAFGVEDEELGEWSRRLRRGKDMSAWLAHAYIGRAEQAGKAHRAEDHGEAVDEPPAALESEFSDEAVKRYATRFKAAMAGRKDPPV